MGPAEESLGQLKVGITVEARAALPLVCGLPTITPEVFPELFEMEEETDAKASFRLNF